jgi:hypothetical protein
MNTDTGCSRTRCWEHLELTKRQAVTGVLASSIIRSIIIWTVQLLGRSGLHTWQFWSVQDRTLLTPIGHLAEVVFNKYWNDDIKEDLMCGACGTPGRYKCVHYLVGNSQRKIQLEEPAVGGRITLNRRVCIAIIRYSSDSLWKMRLTSLTLKSRDFLN